MIKLIKIKDPKNHFDTTDVCVRCHSGSLPDILEDMKLFLQACGYSIKGDLVDSNDYEEEE
jgi:hypothetical protein